MAKSKNSTISSGRITIGLLAAFTTIAGIISLSRPQDDDGAEARLKITANLYGPPPRLADYSKVPWQRFEGYFLSVMERHNKTLADPAARKFLYDWFATFDSLRDKSIYTKLMAVNTAVDTQIGYCDDQITYPGDHYDVWLQSGQKITIYDHWATPFETLLHKKGDCEDFAILKYYLLRYLGVPAENLHLAIVDCGDRKPNHVVLMADPSETPPAAPCPEKLIVLDLGYLQKLGRTTPRISMISKEPQSGCRPYEFLNEKEFIYNNLGTWIVRKRLQPKAAPQP